VANHFLGKLDKHVEELGTSGVAKLPNVEISVFYEEAKDMTSGDPKTRLLAIQAAEKAFEPKPKPLLEAASKGIADANEKIMRTWEASSKDDVELVKAVKAMDKAFTEQVDALQKKLLMACRISAAEAQKLGRYSGGFDCHANVKIMGKVVESSEAKGAMGAAMDSAEAQEAAIEALLKILGQMLGNVKEAAASAQKCVAPLNESIKETADLVNEMKGYAKTKGLKEAVAIKAGVMTLQKHMKLLGTFMVDANSELWEAQRRLKLVEKNVKTLKNTPAMSQWKACDVSLNKAEEPFMDWLKAKALIEAALKPWDGKTVRDYTKLALLLKDIKTADPLKGIKTAQDQGEKLQEAVEAAGKSLVA
jgi:hypothetical protein